jgi:hypothetical protein
MSRVNTTKERVELETIDKSAAVMRQIQGQWNQLRSSIDTVKNTLAAVGVTVGAGAMLALYHDVLKANAAMDDLSESTGSSVETLSGLSRVAKVGSTDFNLVTESMGRMIKGLKGADEEGQNAAAALAHLGVSAKNADGTFRDQGEVMVEVAQKLSMYADSGNKVAIVQDLYGKGAQKLLPYLKDLAEGTDRLNTLTGKQAAEAEAAEKNIRRLQLAFEDTRRELTIEFTPALSDFIEKLMAARRATGNIVAGAAMMLFTDSDNAAAELRRLKAELADLEKPSMFSSGWLTGPLRQQAISGTHQQIAFLEMLQAQRGAATARLGRSDPNSPLFEFGGQPLDYQSPSKKKDPKGGLAPYDAAVLQLKLQASKAQFQDNEYINTQLEIQAGKYGELTEAQKQHLLQLAAERTVQQSLAAQRKEEIEGREKAAQGINEYNEALQKTADHYLDLAEPYRVVMREQETLNLLLEKGIITLEQYQAVQNHLVDTRINVIKISSESQAAAAAGQSLGLSFASAMDQIVFNSGRAVHGLDLLKAAALDVAKVVYGQLVTDPLAKGIGAGLKKFLEPDLSQDAFAQGNFAGGGVMTSRGPMPLRRYGSGGVASRAQLAVFGEGSQPEAYVPLPDGRRIPVQMKGDSAHSISITYGDINVGAGVSRAEVRYAMEVTKRATIAHINDTRSRGG